MSNASFTIAVSQQTNPDVTRTGFIGRALVTIVGGTYVAGGFGPLGIAGLCNIAMPGTGVPKQSVQSSTANPPSGYHWVYNYGTDKLMAYVGQASGAADAEFSGTIASDTVAIEQTFAR